MKRVIPCLLLRNKGLVKTVKFKDPKYVGDPINAVKIFNDKEVDELIFLDITATATNKEPDITYLKDIASECFMPLCYGGGVSTLLQIEKILSVGVEKVAINTQAFYNNNLIKEASRIHGSSTIVVSMDVKKNLWGKYQVFVKNGLVNTHIDPIEYSKKMEDLGAGEIMLNCIDNDGTMLGYNINLIQKIADNVNIPVIACGGAGNLGHFKQAIVEGHASAVAAGSFFVFHGKHRAVLITYPSSGELKNLFS